MPGVVGRGTKIADKIMNITEAILYPNAHSSQHRTFVSQLLEILKHTAAARIYVAESGHQDIDWNREVISIENGPGMAARGSCSLVTSKFLSPSTLFEQSIRIF